ncbi:Hypothetical protein SRAE_0000050750 [Strongyloides ratti]|uniref:Uncharacterized protein n=1 Tax=Strongyloides ratti TaxID=34506 RepID=A0A090KZT0_STRRB|nr:Hypothetical protein SRAE_0000050750 [Strongyloides ratti]CEF61382.1 Hypothetical protein SRAE_0000050750 [Strongyloides ratti]
MNFYNNFIIIFSVFFIISTSYVSSWFSNSDTQKIVKTIERITSEEIASINNKISSLSDTFFLTISGMKETVEKKSKTIDESHNLMVWIIISFTFISCTYFLKNIFSCFSKCCLETKNLPYSPNHPSSEHVYGRRRLSMDRRNTYYDV